MRKQVCAMTCALALSAVMMTGCQKNVNQTVEPDDTTKKEVVSDEPAKEGTDTADVQKGEAENSANTDSKEEKRTAVIYCLDEEGEVTTRQTEIKEEKDIWTELQKDGILTEECEMLSVTRDDSTKEMELDFNRATGDRIRNMGTTGEVQIIGCIVNSYLETYSCDRILLTEEGAPLETSHASYNGYSEMFDFE